MKLNVAVQMDPIARINIRGDSTFALLLEAQKRGHAISYYTPDKLSLRGEELVAPVQVLTVRDEVGNHFTLGEPKRTALTLRRHPAAAGPAVRSRLHHLDASLGAHSPQDAGRQRSRQRAQRAGKLFVLNFPQLMPPTLISRDSTKSIRSTTSMARSYETVARPWRRGGVSRDAGGHDFGSLFDMFFVTFASPG